MPGGTKASVVFASAGGYPRDLNLYQAIKPMRNAAKLLQEGGTLVMCAECPEGAGNTVLERWALEAGTPAEMTARLHRGFVLGGHKAHLLADLVQKAGVVLVSSMPGPVVRNFFMTPAESFAAALKLVAGRHGPDFEALVIPEAGLVLPG